MGGSHRLSSSYRSPKSSVDHVYGYVMMGRMPGGHLERRGWGYGGQHGSMVPGVQMLTYQTYGHHSRLYKHNVYTWGGLNER